MIYGYTLFEGGRIQATMTPPQEGMATLDFPEDFDFSKQQDYKVVDGELVYDPLA